MRFLAWHVDYVRAEPTERGRSTSVEAPRPVSAQNALLVFANFEKSDEPHPMEIVGKATVEIASIAGQLKVTTVVLNPFAHLFAEPSRPVVAAEMLGQLQLSLAGKGLEVESLSFGLFYELELRAKGHRLSRIARTVS